MRNDILCAFWHPRSRIKNRALEAFVGDLVRFVGKSRRIISDAAPPGLIGHEWGH